MLAAARPLFENLPGTFADPLGLADQQAPGVVALIVARYDESTPTNVSNASTASTPDQTTSPLPSGEGQGEGAFPPFPIPAVEGGHPLSPASEASATYDTFVAASGGLVAVARTTPDYRFPVAPAAAVARFHAARDAGRAPALSLFAVAEADAAQFLETAFYAECLKVHVDGPGSADLVRSQLARCGCTDGLLEANDFSDPAAPTVRLAEVSGDRDADLDALLAGVRGRVLLYDRAKNQAVAADRASAPLDLAAAVAEADRLARARRLDQEHPATASDSEPPPSPIPAAEGGHPPSPANRQVGEASEASAVADDLRQRAEQPAPPSPLSALVAELQGRPPRPHPVLERDPLATQEVEPPSSPGGAGGSRPTEAQPRPAEHEPPTDALPAPRSHPPVPAAAPPPHPLAPDLDRLRTDAYALLEAAVGRDRAAALDAHVRAEHGWPSPVPSEHTVAHLRALLLDNPPRRWHLFKRARAKTHGDVAALLLAFHAAHGHDPRPPAQEAVFEATQLWTRLHK